MTIEEAEKYWYSGKYFEKYRAYGKEKCKEISWLLTDAGLSGKPRLVVIVNAIMALEKEND